MNCPQCGINVINASGICPGCGYKVSEPVSKPASEVKRELSGAIVADVPMKHPETAPNAETKWRDDVHQRFAAAQEKKDGDGANPAAAALRAEAAERIKMKKTIARPSDASLQRTMLPFKEAVQTQAVTQTNALRPEIAELKPVDSVQNVEIKNLIDKVVLRGTELPESSAPFIPPVDPVLKPDKTVNPAMSKADTRIIVPPSPDRGKTEKPTPDEPSEGRLILLSRTLSGLIDLVLIILFSGSFIAAADYFVGIVTLDARSMVSLAVLFLMIYFGYSLFFLTTSNQTIGMMITELRVISAGKSRPSFRQAAIRSGAFFISLLPVGIGLLWSLFNRDCRCLHDHLSGTIVSRM